MTAFKTDSVVGRAPALETCLRTARLVAATDATVLVTGETGTGKELLAQAVHRDSPRAAGPLPNGQGSVTQPLRGDAM